MHSPPSTSFSWTTPNRFRWNPLPRSPFPYPSPSSSTFTYTLRSLSCEPSSSRIDGRSMAQQQQKLWLWLPGLLLLLAAIVSDRLTCFVVLAAVSASNEDLVPHLVNNNTAGICAIFVLSRGYPCQEFKVPTDDGYLLSVQRMGTRQVVPHKGPVFLYHGLMQGGDIWVLSNPDESLGFLLADAGYDVFIGSTRSSRFSYGHLVHKQSDEQYWDWNWDDLIAEDFRAMLKFVYTTSTNQPVLFVGYSQGTMTGFAALTQPDMAVMVKKAVMLSPIAYLKHVSSPFVAAAAWLFLDKVFLLAGVHQFNLSNAGGKQFINKVCGQVKLSNCYGDMLNLVTGPNCCLNRSLIPYYDKFELQSTSMKNVAHMAQLTRSGKFSKYDYGWFRNLFIYGRFSPPSYDLSAIPRTLPVLLAHGGNDQLADARDVKHLVEELPEQTQVLLVPNYAHGDFVLGFSARTEVYERVLLFFQESR